MDERFTCGRRAEGYAYADAGVDRWVEWPGQPERMMCSYCGSMRPEAVFESIEHGGRLTPTDKSYKLYVQVDEHEEKFYFQHFDEAHKMRFIMLLNDHAHSLGQGGEPVLNIAEPGYFYVTPFFVRY